MIDYLLSGAAISALSIMLGYSLAQSQALKLAMQTEELSRKERELLRKMDKTNHTLCTNYATLVTLFRNLERDGVIAINQELRDLLDANEDQAN